jgi:hypothetical protein
MLGMAVRLLLVSCLLCTTSATYQLVQDYSGDAFWQGFDFFTSPDPTEGHVVYQSLESANATQLAGFIEDVDANNAIYVSRISVAKPLALTFL